MPLNPGTRLSHYEVLEPIGAGGMGEVYRARDTKLKRDVAVKVLPLADPERVTRFEREAQAVAQLSHPNILAVHDFGQDHDVPYIVTELLEGESLRERLDGSKLPARKAVEVGLAIAEGLAAAHGKGIVHRDLKPENLFLTRDGQVKILDFGLARADALVAGEEEETAHRTEPGAVMGTVGYMSPEQVRGQAVDARSDIFSFGSVLYEMLSGERAFRRGTAAETMTAILKEQPPELSDSGAMLSPQLERVVRHALEKEPEQRFQSARDLAFALNAALTDSGTSQLTAVQDRPRSRIGLVAGLAVAAVVAGGSAFVLTRDRAPVPAPEAVLDENRVVVAVFENQTGDETLDSLGRIAADWITQGLSRAEIPVVPVSTLSANEPSTGPDRLRDLAEQSGAARVVSGTYYRQADTLHFQARVTNASTSELLDAIDPVSGAASDPMTVVDELRQNVVGALAFRSDPLLREQLHAPPRYDAYQEFVAARGLFGRDYDRAVQHYERAAELDPDFMAPRLLMAVAFGNQGRYEEAEPVLDVLRQNRERLSTFERHQLDWYTAAIAGDEANALRFLRLAEGLAPRDVQIKYLIGLSALRQNRPAITVDSLGATDPSVWAPMTVAWPFEVLARGHHVLGNYTLELETVRRGQEDYPGLALRDDEARALAAMGRVEDVEGVVEESLATASTGDAVPVLLVAAQELRAHGNAEPGDAILARALERLRSETSDRRQLARALFIAREWDAAVTLFEELAAERPDDLELMGYRGVLAAKRGDTDQAEASSRTLASLDDPYLLGGHTYWRAAIAAALGDRDAAVGLLRDAMAQGLERRGSARSGGFRVRIDHLHRDPNFETLWGYPPFQEVLRPKD